MNGEERRCEPDIDQLRVIARRGAVRLGLLDWTEDLTQELALEAVSRDIDGSGAGQVASLGPNRPLDPSWAVERALEIAGDEKARRRATGVAHRHAARVPRHGRSLAKASRGRSRRRAPTLCPVLDSLAGPGRLGNDFRALVLRASLKVVREGALRRGRKGRQLAFLSIYGLAGSIDEVSRSMKLSPRAAVEMLRRASDTVELVLLAMIEPEVRLGDAMPQDVLRARIGGALQRLLDRDTGHSYPPRTVPHSVKNANTF